MYVYSQCDFSGIINYIIAVSKKTDVWSIGPQAFKCLKAYVILSLNKKSMLTTDK